MHMNGVGMQFSNAEDADVELAAFSIRVNQSSSYQNEMAF